MVFVVQSCNTPSALSYTDYHSAEYIKLSQNSLEECTLPVFTTTRLPSEEYLALGYCEVFESTTSRLKATNNIEKLSACACKFGGDAIILINLDQELKVEWVPDYNSGLYLLPKKRKTMETRIRAQVIKYQDEEELNLKY